MLLRENPNKMSSSASNLELPVKLPFESIDDLIYDARSGDLDALKTDIASLGKQYDCSESLIVASAIDTEAEAEGGTGCCLLHFPAANGNIGMSVPFSLSTIFSSCPVYVTLLCFVFLDLLQKI